MSEFKLPCAVVKELERLFKDFLWNKGERKKGGTKVAWKKICKPKDQGGLGLKDLEKRNDMFLIKHIWNLLSGRDTIWVDWIQNVRLKRRNFWEVEKSRHASWLWNHMLDMRGQVSKFLMVKLGDGRTASVGFDKWCTSGPLSKFITNRSLYSAGFEASNSVADVIDQGCWKWPQEWFNSWPMLSAITVPQLEDSKTDCII